MKEFAEIPKHLQETLPSAASYEEGMRRDYQIRVSAWERGIPQTSLDNPTVYRYVSVLRDVAAAHRREDLTDPYLQTRRAVPAPSHGSESDRRLRQYGVLNLLSHTLLTEGFPGSTGHVSDVGHYLDALVKPLGTIAENVFEHEQYRPDVVVSRVWSRVGRSDSYPEAVVDVDEAVLGKYSGWWTRGRQSQLIMSTWSDRWASRA